MSQALSEFRSPVGQEALRLRMVAMHGREDPLLDAGRFPRLLRQANDAEVADVRKVGDDDYEITLQRQPTRTALPSSPREEAADTASGDEAAPEPVTPGPRENGQRLGLRFRRGSRGHTRAAEIPLIGVVSIESTPEELSIEPADIIAAEIPGPEAEKPARAPRARRKRATAAPAESNAGGATEESTPPVRPKRPRARPRKKTE